ncbi:MAG: 3-oxoacyl-(acyl-carrier-protein) synthase, partial [Bacteroidetes bacterium]|nr:3-oxoacyl-(acyl-carrier-protein) synthase [Bacteroidota bacterium]
MELKRVVVTGVGAVTPLGLSVAETWQNVLSGKSGAAPITHFDTSLFKTKFACEVKGFDPLQYFDRKEARKMDIYTQFALVATREAIENSGIDLEAT